MCIRDSGGGCERVMGQGGRPNTCGAPGAVYWLREVRRAEDGVEKMCIRDSDKAVRSGLYVELVGAAVGGQEGDGITRQKFEFGIARHGAEDGNTQASANCVLFQAVQEWKIRLICLKGTSCA